MAFRKEAILTEWLVMTNHLYRIQLAFVALTIAGCVTGYGDLPRIDIHSDPIPKKSFPIFYHMELGADYYGYTEIGQRHRDIVLELRRTFAHNRIFSSVIETPTPPDKGLYCSGRATFENHPFSETRRWLVLLHPLTLWLFPIYDDREGRVFEYELFLDGTLQKRYRYEFRTKMWISTALLPFLWLNLLTPNLEEAAKSTVYQFWIDAERDGYFSAKTDGGM